MENEDDKDKAKVLTKTTDLAGLKKLYTQGAIPSAPVYASNFTYLFCVLLYSIGCPLMYVLGAMFFTVQYWWYKYLLLNYF